MIKRTLLAAAIFSALPAYAGLTSITAGYDFTDYSGDHGNRNLAYAELVAKVENATLLFNLSQGRRDYETEHFNATRGQGAVWYKWNNWLTTRTGIAFADNTPVFARQDFRQDINRSEEHTSELQSRFDFVCRLLLEKNNKAKYT